MAQRLERSWFGFRPWPSDKSKGRAGAGEGISPRLSVRRTHRCETARTPHARPGRRTLCEGPGFRKPAKGRHRHSCADTKEVACTDFLLTDETSGSSFLMVHKIAMPLKTSGVLDSMNYNVLLANLVYILDFTTLHFDSVCNRMEFYNRGGGRKLGSHLVEHSLVCEPFQQYIPDDNFQSSWQSPISCGTYQRQCAIHKRVSPANPTTPPPKRSDLRKWRFMFRGYHKVSTELTNWNNLFATYLTDKRFIGIPINQQ